MTRPLAGSLIASAKAKEPNKALHRPCFAGVGEALTLPIPPTKLELSATKKIKIFLIADHNAKFHCSAINHHLKSKRFDPGYRANLLSFNQD